MKTLIIDRRKWLRLSEDSEYSGSSLCDSEDKKNVLPRFLSKITRSITEKFLRFRNARRS